jgi:hypothetical protein
LTQLLERRSTKVVAIALANKIARTAWATMAHGTCYQGLQHRRFETRAGLARAHQVGKGN